MPEFIRQPKNGVSEGQTFVEVRNGEVVAQKCHEGKCVEVRKSLEKNGKPVSSDSRLKIIYQAKEELVAKCLEKPKMKKAQAKKKR